MKKLWLTVPLLALSGCSMFTADKPFPLEETSPSEVRKCRKVAKFPGPEGYRFWGPPAVLSDFKWKSAEQAKQMGATHMYWREDPESLKGEISGFAYDCTGVDMPDDNADEEGF